MIFRETRIPGAWTIDITPSADHRGFFAMAWSANELAKRGLNTAFTQCNLAFNHQRGTLRGMHFQKSPHAQAKMISVTRGALLDVIVDLRDTSPTFKQWDAIELTADNRRMVYMPEGIAHGYLTLVDNTEANYLVSSPWVPSAESGVRWDDSVFAIAWPFAPLVISERDEAWPPWPR